jgi:VanZ family protein
MMAEIRNLKVYIWLILAIGYAALIVILSSMPKLTPPDVGFGQIDKLLHMAEYFVFGILWMKAFSLFGFLRRNRIVLILVLYGIVFAVLDEFHQNFVPSRNMDSWDLIADIGGLILSVIVYYSASKIRHKRLPSPPPNSIDIF